MFSQLIKSTTSCIEKNHCAGLCFAVHIYRHSEPSKKPLSNGAQRFFSWLILGTNANLFIDLLD